MTREQAIEMAVRTCLTYPVMRKMLWVTQLGGPFSIDGRHWTERVRWIINAEFARLMQ